MYSTILHTTPERDNSGSRSTPSLQFERITVPASLRKTILCRYPGLEANPAYWGLLQVLLYGTFRDKKTDAPVIPQAMLAEIEGKQAELATGSYSGVDFLDRFNRDVLSITYTQHSFRDGKARVITDCAVAPYIIEACTNDLNVPWTPKDRVYFVTGCAFTRKKQIAIRKQIQSTVLERGSSAKCEEAHIVLDYLNTRSPNRFSAAMRHLEQAQLTASRITEGVELTDFQLKAEAVRLHQLRILRHIASQPIPFYMPTERSCRIFPFEQHIPSLKSTVRAALTQDWYGIDLKSAQLAICATEWKIEAVQAFLREGRSIWTSMFEHFGWESQEITKSIFKKALYAVTFGAGEKRVRAIFIEKNLYKEHADHFLSHQLIVAMWQARTLQQAQIRKDRGAYDCFGNWINWWPKDEQHPNERSVLAQLAQAVELKLMFPIVELARQTDEFDIVLWLHDGCYLDFKDLSKADRWKHRIEQAVNTQAMKMGIHTYLEQKS